MGFRPVFYVVGIFIVAFALSMLVPASVDYALGHQEYKAFLYSAAMTLFVGASLSLACRPQKNVSFTIRQAFLLSPLAWVSLCFFGALPFVFRENPFSLVDALFESTSGITTTGSTVITGLQALSPGSLLWRSLLQWLGGVGFIVMAVSILPILQIGGMQLFKGDAFDQRKGQVVLGALQLASQVSLLYVIITVLGAVAYYLAGMSAFDAINHAMTSVATGGYSTKDTSIGFFRDSPGVDLVAITLMITGSLPFIILLRAFQADLIDIWKDSQVRVFLGVLGFFIFVVSFHLIEQREFSFWYALRHAAFNVTSVMTGTGYATHNYVSWGHGYFISVLMLFLMFIGGCAGSTSCGIKIFRFQVLYVTAKTQLKRLIHPHGVFLPYYEKKPITEDVSIAVMGFFFLFITTFALTSIVISLYDETITGQPLDMITVISSAATAIANVGPGLGDIVGPAGNFATMPNGVKVTMSIVMILGRLELFTIFVLFLPMFWKE